MNRPAMRFVPVKTTERQAALMLVGFRDRYSQSNAARKYDPGLCG